MLTRGRRIGCEQQDSRRMAFWPDYGFWPECQCAGVARACDAWAMGIVHALAT